MRLIDADAFADKLKEISARQHYDKSLINNFITVDDVIDSIIAELKGTGLDGFENCPTVEERPTAEWISCEEDDLKISDYRCSYCGKYQDEKTNFCSRCGAKMKKEKNI